MHSHGIVCWKGNSRHWFWLLEADEADVIQQQVRQSRRGLVAFSRLELREQRRPELQTSRPSRAQRWMLQHFIHCHTQEQVVCTRFLGSTSIFCSVHRPVLPSPCTRTCHHDISARSSSDKFCYAEPSISSESATCMPGVVFQGACGLIASSLWCCASGCRDGWPKI